MNKKLHYFKNWQQQFFIGLVFVATLYTKPALSQSDFNIEASAVFSTFNFSAKGGTTSTTAASTDYSHTTVSAFSLGYTHTSANGLLLIGSIGVRQAGSSLIYNSITYIWNMHYADLKAGVGYQFNKWRLKPYVALCPYYGYLLSGTQTFNQEIYDLKADKSLKSNDYGLFANVGFKATLSPYISVYTEYNYIYGLQNIETAQNQYLYNRGFSVKFGVALTISNSTKPKEETQQVPVENLAGVSKPVTAPPAAEIGKFGDGWAGKQPATNTPPSNVKGTGTSTNQQIGNTSGTTGSTSGVATNNNNTSSNAKGTGNSTNQQSGNTGGTIGSTSGIATNNNNTSPSNVKGTGTSGTQQSGNTGGTAGSTSGVVTNNNNTSPSNVKGTGTSTNQQSGNTGGTIGSTSGIAANNTNTSPSNVKGTGTSGTQQSGNTGGTIGSTSGIATNNRNTSPSNVKGTGTSTSQQTGNTGGTTGSTSGIATNNTNAFSSDGKGTGTSGNQQTGNTGGTAGSTNGIATNNTTTSPSNGKETGTPSNQYAGNTPLTAPTHPITSTASTTTIPSRVKEKEIPSSRNSKSVNPNVVFKVQLTAVKNPLTNSHPLLKALKGKVEKEKGKDGWIRYYSGSFKSYEEAHAELNKLKSKGLGVGGFVVAFKNGKKITVAEANDLLH